jgi:hypothetical protein
MDTSTCPFSHGLSHVLYVTIKTNPVRFDPRREDDTGNMNKVCDGDLAVSRHATGMLHAKDDDSRLAHNNSIYGCDRQCLDWLWFLPGWPPFQSVIHPYSRSLDLPPQLSLLWAAGYN